MFKKDVYFMIILVFGIPAFAIIMITILTMIGVIEIDTP